MINSDLIREHTFNLRGRAMVVFGVKFFFLTSQRSRHFLIFFSTKTIFFKAHANKIFFLPISETEFFFQSNLPTEFFPPKNHSPPPFQVKWMFPNTKKNQLIIVKKHFNWHCYCLLYCVIIWHQNNVKWEYCNVVIEHCIDHTTFESRS